MIGRRITAAALAPAAAAAALMAPPPAAAVETQTRLWRTVADFAPGEMDHVSVAPAGRLVLSPDYRRISDLDEPVAWALAELDGQVLVATGHEGKVLKAP